jgi:hypothetical protein
MHAGARAPRPRRVPPRPTGPTARDRSTEPRRLARWGPYLDLRGRAGAAGAEEAIGRRGGGLGGLGGGGADGVGAAVARFVGAAVPHRRRDSTPTSAARRRGGRDLRYRKEGRERVGVGVAAASSQRRRAASGVVETTRQGDLDPTQRSSTVRAERKGEEVGAGHGEQSGIYGFVPRRLNDV